MTASWRRQNPASSPALPGPRSAERSFTLRPSSRREKGRSAEIAVDLVRSLFPDKADLFAENDLHIHVPEGAVKKDGPSAGITLTTAISSLVTGIAVDPHVAMTGEVSLRGAVMPIGGLPEKLMAAQRAGVTHVFIPRENMEDLDEVADDVKNKLTITPVDNVTDVLQALHIMN